MGIENHSSKGGNYVGGFLQLFDWNAKSRKKLFSSKSDLPEKSKQQKRFDGNLPMTRLQMLDEDEIAGGSSIKGISDYSRASSVTDEDFHGTRAPGVVARLMGLDSLPRSNSPESYSTPLFDSQSLPGSFYQCENLEYRQDPQIMRASSSHKAPYQNDMEAKYQIHRPIEKFQTEILPPKSAKSIPITHHKLLSPIKRTTFIPPEDAAHIMEAAARIIEPGPQACTRAKLPMARSSAAPLKVRDLTKKTREVQKPSKLSEGCQRSAESSAVKNLKGHSMNKSWNGSVDAKSIRILPDSEESSIGAKSKGKSISLALQAKANVQKREGLSLNSSRTLVVQNEMSEVSPNQLSAQKGGLKKPSRETGSNVLRHNNQKQNSTVDGGKLPMKSDLQEWKAVTGDISSATARQRNSSKPVGTSKVSSRKLGSEVKDDKRQVLSSSSERVRKKRTIDGNYHSEKNQAAHNMRKDKNGKIVQSTAVMDMQSRRDHDSGRMGTDVISFTFTAPLTRSGPGSGRSTVAGDTCKIFPVDSRNKRILLNSDGSGAQKFSFPGHSVKVSDTLSTVLEQKLKELTHKVELAQQKSETALHVTIPGLNALTSSTMLEESKCNDGNHTDSLDGQPGSSLYSLRDPKGFINGQKCQILVEETSMHGRCSSIDRTLLDCRLPSPVSVLEHSSFADSCNSSDATDSNSTGGGKHCSSFQFPDMLGRHSMNTFLPFEGDAELSDSASSSSAGMMVKRRETTLTLPYRGKLGGWELKYVNEMVSNIELMFKDYALGGACEIINPHLFDQLESRKGHFNGCGLFARINRRLMFDCVNECLEMRCRRYLAGGSRLWGKGLAMVKRKEKLAEDVHKEISSWSCMGDFMVDELVDNDMSSSQHGRWLDYEIEAFQLGIQIESRILDSLIDEVVTDIC
ncbi:hypothetical protein Salat_1786800 [Sesamum alatum]|uniref:DUF4378 domain-containing protein n=1 Tax=Sesamum alatum TaxID=300844 RepID=A0AAE2CKX6_9LAMI|nr:hypothetical protein Salat_1786800 [Sesamum alatum]